MTDPKKPAAPVVDARKEVMRLMREDFDPTPPGWEGREWDDNAEDVADKIIAALAQQPRTEPAGEAVQVTEAERDFLLRVKKGLRLKLADHQEDRVRQRMRKLGLAKVVMNPRRWVLTETGHATLATPPLKGHGHDE